MNGKSDYTRREFLKQAGLGAAAFTVSGLADSRGFASEAGQTKQPNIIFIMADDLGYGHLGCYGQENIRTPHVDRLAAEGMRFTRCYAGAPVCAPSRSVLMTGLHCGHTSVRGNSGGLELVPEDVTVGEVLKDAGYATGIFGKWGLGDAGTTGVPNRQGFDEFFGYLHQVHAHFYYPYYLWKNEERFLLPGNEGGKREQYTQDVIVDEAEKFIRGHKDAPFFLYLPFTVPHTELLVPEDSFKEYEGIFPEPNPYEGEHYASQPSPRTAYAAMVTRMDREVGRIVAVLEELGIDGNTVVFFTSDNGGQRGGGPDLDFFQGNGPLRGAKGQLYEGGIRVPMIARWPGRIAAGTVSDHIWAFEDVLPTLAALGGGKSPAGIDGVSVAPTLLGPEAAGHAQEIREFYYWESGAARQAVRMVNWKAVCNGKDKPLELYNLANDIGEQNNVADANPDIAATMKTYLRDARTAPRKYRREPSTWGYKALDTGYVR